MRPPREVQFNNVILFVLIEVLILTAGFLTAHSPTPEDDPSYAAAVNAMHTFKTIGLMALVAGVALVVFIRNRRRRAANSETADLQ